MRLLPRNDIDKAAWKDTSSAPSNILIDTTALALSDDERHFIVEPLRRVDSRWYTPEGAPYKGPVPLFWHPYEDPPSQRAGTPATPDKPRLLATVFESPEAPGIEIVHNDYDAIFGDDRPHDAAYWFVRASDWYRRREKHGPVGNWLWRGSRTWAASSPQYFHTAEAALDAYIDVYGNNAPDLADDET